LLIFKQKIKEKYHHYLPYKMKTYHILVGDIVVATRR